jgi:hypothetical protein
MLPIFLRGFGYVVIGICVLSVLNRVPLAQETPLSQRINPFAS